MRIACLKKTTSTMFFLLVGLIVAVDLVCTSSLCPNSLQFRETVYIDETQTFSLRLCCNITRLWFGQLNNEWNLLPVPGLQWIRLENLTMPGFDLLVSKCHDDEPYVLGELMGPGCHSLRGNIVTLTKAVDRLPEFDQWYITCFEVQQTSLNSHSPCKICRLSMYCTHQRRCKDKFLHREIVNASLTSITIVLNVGNLPFEAEILTEVTQTSNNKNSSTDVGAHYTNSVTAPRNRSLKYEIDGLKLNTWYQISTCAIVKTPAHFRLAHPNIPLPAEEKFCLAVEGYRTSRPRNHHNYKNSAVTIVNVCPLHIFIFCSMLTYFLASG